MCHLLPPDKKVIHGCLYPSEIYGLLSCVVASPLCGCRLFFLLMWDRSILLLTAVDPHGGTWQQSLFSLHTTMNSSWQRMAITSSESRHRLDRGRRSGRWSDAGPWGATWWDTHHTHILRGYAHNHYFCLYTIRAVKQPIISEIKCNGKPILETIIFLYGE